MTKKILLYTTPGAYGHFLDWCIRYFSTEDDLELPFGQGGNAHGKEQHKGWSDSEIVGHIVQQNYDQAVASTNRMTWVTHPSVHPAERVYQDFDHIVHVTVGMRHRQWLVNNIFDKVNLNQNPYQDYKQWTDNIADWKMQSQYTVNDWTRCQAYIGVHGKPNNWADYGQPSYRLMQKWQVRECLSFWNWQDIVDYTCFYNQGKPLAHEKTIHIDFYDLRQNFEHTITRMLTACDLPVIKQDFRRVYDAWITRQVHKDKDRMLIVIMKNIDTGLDFDFDEPLTFYDEIAIQKMLREKGYELKCDGLNTFPITMQQLRDIIV